MKKAVILIDKTKKEQVKKYLDDNNIVWADESLFRFDFPTAIVTLSIVALLLIVFTSL